MVSEVLCFSQQEEKTSYQKKNQKIKSFISSMSLYYTYLSILSLNLITNHFINKNIILESQPCFKMKLQCKEQNLYLLTIKKEFFY